MLLGLEFCAWYILLVCPNHPRINLSFLGHCLSYDENLDGLSTLYTPHSTPWTFSTAESHKLNRKLHIKLIRKDKKWKHYGTGRFVSESSQNPFFGTWKFYPKSFFFGTEIGLLTQCEVYKYEPTEQKVHSARKKRPTRRKTFFLYHNFQTKKLSL